MSLPTCLIELIGTYTVPPDSNLDAIRAHMVANPRDEIAILVYADRLDELGKTELAASYRTEATMLRAVRGFIESVAIQSLSVVTHILRGDPEPSSPNEKV